MMKKAIATVSLGTILFVANIICSELTYAEDLDDGMGKYTSESIAKDDEALEPDQNEAFIVVGASSGGSQSKDKDGVLDKNENSIIVGPGANISGDLIIVAPPR